MTIAKDIGRNIPAPYALKKLLVEPAIGADPDLMYGVELEIENLNPEVHKEDFCVAGTVYHEDGSLRNNGGEFVTKPMKLRELQYVLNQFFMKNKFNEDNYSERCSVHVHANVGDMEWEQVKTLLLVYQVFERSLFSFIGEERDKNIFCVPLYDTQLTQNLINRKGIDVASKWKSWEKYTALNLLPIFSQTTIEFRHMGGTCDLNRIMLWCNIIGCLFAFAKRESFEDASKYFLSLNTTSAYKEAVFRVFGEWSYVLLSLPTHEQDMEDGVLTAKYACGDKDSPKARTWYDEAALLDAVRAAGRIRPAPLPRQTMPVRIDLPANPAQGGFTIYDDIRINPVPQPFNLEAAEGLLAERERELRDQMLNEQNERAMRQLEEWVTTQDEGAF